MNETKLELLDKIQELMKELKKTSMYRDIKMNIEPSVIIRDHKSILQFFVNVRETTLLKIIMGSNEPLDQLYSQYALIKQLIEKYKLFLVEENVTKNIDDKSDFEWDGI